MKGEIRALIMLRVLMMVVSVYMPFIVHSKHAIMHSKHAIRLDYDAFEECD